MCDARGYLDGVRISVDECLMLITLLSPACPYDSSLVGAGRGGLFYLLKCCVFGIDDQGETNGADFDAKQRLPSYFRDLAFVSRQWPRGDVHPFALPKGRLFDGEGQVILDGGSHGRDLLCGNHGRLSFVIYKGDHPGDVVGFF